MKRRDFEGEGGLIEKVCKAVFTDVSGCIREKMSFERTIATTLTDEERNRLAHEITIKIPEEIIREFIDDGISEAQSYSGGKS